MLSSDRVERAQWNIEIAAFWTLDELLSRRSHGVESGADHRQTISWVKDLILQIRESAVNDFNISWRRY